MRRQLSGPRTCRRAACQKFAGQDDTRPPSISSTASLINLPFKNPRCLSHNCSSDDRKGMISSSGYQFLRRVSKGPGPNTSGTGQEVANDVAKSTLRDHNHEALIEPLRRHAAAAHLEIATIKASV
eukprot:GHVU01182971.1.p1 GENE.GHVU01182971.1~~GHVU01182971.1.p1  ORF type:complete len:126 (-),score=10.17 GHVU01182971.1:4-381(-)